MALLTLSPLRCRPAGDRAGGADGCPPRRPGVPRRGRGRDRRPDRHRDPRVRRLRARPDVSEPVPNWQHVIRSGGYSPSMRDVRRRQFEASWRRPGVPGLRVLEAGSGPGDNLAILVECGVRAYGVEASPANVAACTAARPDRRAGVSRPAGGSSGTAHSTRSSPRTCWSMPSIRATSWLGSARTSPRARSASWRCRASSGWSSAGGVTTSSPTTSPTSPSATLRLALELSGLRGGRDGPSTGGPTT